MAANSAIEWTDHTFNAWRGCTKVHAGCTNCYAEVNYSVKMHGVKWGPNGTRVKLSHAGWKEPLKWNREAEAAGERRRVFCASLADVFEDWQGPILHHNGDVLHWRPDLGIAPLRDAGRDTRPATLDDLRRDLFKLIDATPMLDWLLLTKRPENITAMWPRHPLCPRQNVWLGTSISDQKTADEWIPRLLKNRDLAPVLFLSCEPLLGPIDLSRWMSGLDVSRDEDGRDLGSASGGSDIDWVIVGGESGHDARPCDTSWVRSIVRQCRDASVPCFVKQMGSNPKSTLGGQHTATGTKQFSFNITDKKGGDIAEWPEDLRVREFPRTEVAHA